MNKSKEFIKEALSTLSDNIRRTGDPLGFKSLYWDDWAKGLNLPKEGDTILLTARMYQMLPYILQTTELISLVRPLMTTKGVNSLVRIGNRLASEWVVRAKAAGAKDIRDKGTKSLRGIVAALAAVGVKPAYLHEDEPYSGTLLYDQGLDQEMQTHARGVYESLKARGVKRIIGTDPHTVHMFRDVFPQYIDGYEIETRHYSEILSEKRDLLEAACQKLEARKFVIHDSCVMTRELGIVQAGRDVAAALGVEIVEPEDARDFTACCGGPIEYAFEELSSNVSAIRANELAGFASDVMVQCPICLINLGKQESKHNIKVSDLGELLYDALKDA